MFWGILLNHEESFTLHSLANQGEILKISKILAESEYVTGDNCLWITSKDQKVLLANLTQKQQSKDIEIFLSIRDEHILTYRGFVPIRVFGYIEPIFKDSSASDSNSSSDEIIPPKRLTHHSESSEEEAIIYANPNP